MLANPSKFAHVVVAGFNYEVNMADKAEIFVKYDTKITSRWSGWDVIFQSKNLKNLIQKIIEVQYFHNINLKSN